ncbi:MAG: NAD(P)H-hydrate dehydratase [Candidatus Parcubacteria bacterium]|nr:NAD(P)H-hydrate dehydratase [Burkholderiales bacterium]
MASPSRPVYLTQDIRRIEKAAGDAPLMERAGAAAADLAVTLLPQNGKDVLVLAGPGNNGGDARIVARILQEKFFRVVLATKAGEIPQNIRWNLVVDGLFGIGLARPVEGEYASLVEYANRQSCPVLALDIASGIESDTGRILGCAVRATHTLTFIGLKPGLLTLDGPDHCGQVSVADLSLKGSQGESGWVAGRSLFANVLKARPRNFHKGMAGSVGIIGGFEGMDGAAVLAGRAALKMGAGRVYVGTDKEGSYFDPQMPELMFRPAPDVLGLDLDAIVIGPGLGENMGADALLGAVLASDIPCVLDADALNLIAASADYRPVCAQRTAETIVTPHPAEAGRLLAESTANVQADRLKAAKILSENLRANVLLKGNGSVIVARDGHWFINTSGHPGMASAGMGDVLSGMLGALLAQKYSGETSLVLGTHLHGCAADECARNGAGPVGLTASELIDPARRIWNRWLDGDD